MYRILVWIWYDHACFLYNVHALMPFKTFSRLLSTASMINFDQCSLTVPCEQQRHPLQGCTTPMPETCARRGLLHFHPGPSPAVNWSKQSENDFTKGTGKQPIAANQRFSPALDLGCKHRNQICLFRPQRLKILSSSDIFCSVLRICPAYLTFA